MDVSRFLIKTELVDDFCGLLLREAFLSLTCFNGLGLLAETAGVCLADFLPTWLVAEDLGSVALTSVGVFLDSLSLRLNSPVAGGLGETAVLSGLRRAGSGLCDGEVAFLAGEGSTRSTDFFGGTSVSVSTSIGVSMLPGLVLKFRGEVSGDIFWM